MSAKVGIFASEVFIATMAGSRNHGWLTKKKDGFSIYVFERSGLSVIYKHTATYKNGVFSISAMVRMEEPDDKEICRGVRWEFRDVGKRLVIVNKLARRKGLTPTQIEIYWRACERPTIDQAKEFYRRFMQAIQTS